MKLSGPLIFFLLVVLCTLFIWPLYQAPIEKDLTKKVQALYTNQIHNTPAISFDGLDLQLGETEIHPHFRRKLERIVGAYIPETPATTSPAPLPPPSSTTKENPAPSTETSVHIEHYSFTLTRTASLINIIGHFPNSTAQESVRNLIQHHSPKSRIHDQSSISSEPTDNADTWWTPHLSRILPEFLKGTYGYALLNFEPSRLVARAKFHDNKALDRLNFRLSKIPTSIEKKLNLKFQTPPPKPPPSAPKPPLQVTPVAPPKAQIISVAESTDPDSPEPESPFANLTISFGGGGSAWLHPKYNDTLTQISDLILDHSSEDQRFIIGSYGTKNQKLSQNRADVVLKKLVFLEVPEERLLIKHFPKKPGKKRRIEITFAPPSELTDPSTTEEEP